MAANLIHLKILSRLYYSSSVCYASVHKTMRKVLGANSTKKRNLQFQDFPIQQNANKLSNPATEVKYTTSKRASMLNKMFMKYITDLMVNGEYWEQYTKFGIEITGVAVSPDYKNLNIFWVTKEIDKIEVIKSFLASHAFTIRHELSQLRVMGVVPPIHFVKDKHQSELMDLDSRMGSADYGLDYEPTYITRIKHQLELYSPIEENLKVQLEELENKCEDDRVDIDVPEMPQNVLGLDHADILNRVQQLKKKSRQEVSVHRTVLQNYNQDKTDGLSARDALNLFLHKRQMMKQKMNKKKKNDRTELESIIQELQEHSSIDHYDNIGNTIDKFDQDFIEEDT